MVKARFSPPADRTSQWVGDGSVRMARIDKLVLHTTESAGGWPDYRGGAIAPNLTYEPWRHEFRQHVPVDGSARTLRDPDSTDVRENRDNAVQIEISCYCDPAKRSTGRFVTDLDDRAHDDLADLVAWLHTEWGLPLVLAPIWLPYPASFGDSPARMSGAEYDRFSGVLGHQHVSGNDHGDPGELDVQRIVGRARRVVGEDRPVPTLDAYRAGDEAAVRAVETELLRRGLLRPGSWADDGRSGTETVAAITAFQRQLGEAAEFADGQFGPRQWERFWS